MKSWLKLSKCLSGVCCLVLSLSLIFTPLVSYADVSDLMIASDSNVLMTMDLTDDDYGISTYSSIASVINTINYGDAYLYVRRNDVDTGVEIADNISLNSAGYANYIVPEGYTVKSVGLHLRRGSIPSSGTYSYEFDFASDVSVDYLSAFIMSRRDLDNATNLLKSNGLTFQENSGDLYSANTIEIGSISDLYFYGNFDPLPAGSAIGGAFKLNFTVSDTESPYYSTVGIGMADTYESDVSSSLSDLSSSVGSMSEDLSSASENLEYISQSQNLIIQGIDNVIMHISDQLYAFWDQLYNLIHEPTYARLGEILDAIKNMDLDITVDFDGLKQSINTMSQEVQNKLQTTTDQITGGYDNTEISSTNQELSGKIDEYEASEDEIMDQISEPLENFEFDNPVTQYLDTFLMFGNFLQSVFVAAGPFGDVINLSFLMSIALMVAGLYRFKGGN